MTNTIFPSIATSADTDGVAVQLFRERVFGDLLDDKANAIAILQQKIQPCRLLSKMSVC